MTTPASANDAGVRLLETLTRIDELSRELGTQYQLAVAELRECGRAVYQARGMRAAQVLGDMNTRFPEEVARLLLGAGLGDVLQVRPTQPIAELAAVWAKRIDAGHLAPRAAAGSTMSAG